MASQSSAGSGLPGRQVLIVFLLFIIVGGGASVAIRITYGALAPFWSATARFGLAATAFWIMVLIKRLPLPRGRTLLGAVIFGVLTLVWPSY